MSCNLWEDNDELQCWPTAFYVAHPPATQYFNPAFGVPLHSSPYNYSAASAFGWPQHSCPTVKGLGPPPVLTIPHSTYSSHDAASSVVMNHDALPWQQPSRLVENNPTSCTHCKATPYAVAKALNNILAVPPAEFLEHMKDRDACNYIAQHFPRSSALRSALNALLMNPVVVIQLSMDGHGNYLIQKAVEEAGPMTRTLFSIFSECMLRLTCNRYGCRVVQKVIECFPIEMIFEIVAKYHGDELTISLDPNASHVIQKVVAFHGPEVFEPFVTAYTECIQNFDLVVLNKYGCHVIQKVLEKLVTYTPSSMNASNSLAAKLLLDIVGRIKQKAHVYVFAEFANYVVQCVLMSPSLAAHSRYIIDNVVVPNARALATDKCGSNVIEKALKVAPAKSFSAICQKLFEGSEKSTTSTTLHEDPLGELIFHKYGNYVVQVAFEESVNIVSGMKCGDPHWFFMLEKRVRKSQERLAGFSSGKRLLQVLKAACRTRHFNGNIGRCRPE